MSNDYISKKDGAVAAVPAKVWQQTSDQDVIHGLDCFVRRLTDIGSNGHVRHIRPGTAEFERIAPTMTPPGVRI